MDTVSDCSGTRQAQAHAERRDCARKACRMRAVLELDAHPGISGKTIDLSLTGVSMLLPRAWPKGTKGTVGFSVVNNGKLETIRARVEVSNCVFLRADVRVGFRFLELDAASRRLLTALLC